MMLRNKRKLENMKHNVMKLQEAKIHYITLEIGTAIFLVRND